MSNLEILLCKAATTSSMLCIELGPAFLYWPLFPYLSGTEYKYIGTGLVRTGTMFPGDTKYTILSLDGNG